MNRVLDIGYWGLGINPSPQSLSSTCQWQAVSKFLADQVEGDIGLTSDVAVAI